MKCITNRLSIGHIAGFGGAAAILLSAGMARAQVIREGDIAVTINGQPVQFADIGPQQIEGRTMVPIRGVLEKLGADISFNNATETVRASTATTDIRLRIGARRALVNGNPVALDTPAQMIQDHTFVPLRFLSEALGAEVRWDEVNRTVVITTGAGAHHLRRMRPGERTWPGRDRQPGEIRRDR